LRALYSMALLSGLRVRHFVSGFALLLLTLSGSVVAAVPDAPNQPLRIVAFGDSTATALDGVARDEETAIVDVLAAFEEYGKQPRAGTSAVPAATPVAQGPEL